MSSLSCTHILWFIHHTSPASVCVCLQRPPLCFPSENCPCLLEPLCPLKQWARTSLSSQGQPWANNGLMHEHKSPASLPEASMTLRCDSRVPSRVRQSLPFMGFIFSSFAVLFPVLPYPSLLGAQPPNNFLMDLHLSICFWGTTQERKPSHCPMQTPFLQDASFLLPHSPSACQPLSSYKAFINLMGTCHSAFFGLQSLPHTLYSSDTKLAFLKGQPTCPHFCCAEYSTQSTSPSLVFPENAHVHHYAKPSKKKPVMRFKTINLNQKKKSLILQRFNPCISMLYLYLVHSTTWQLAHPILLCPLAFATG